MDRQQAVGRRIRAARERLGWSQQYLAKLYGSSDVTISRIERGVVGLSIAELEKMARILGQPLEYFLSDEVPYHARPLDSIIRELNAIQPRAIPVLEQLASAGEGVLAQDYVYLSREKAAGDNIVAIVAKGDCLVPEVHAGDTLIIDLDASAKDGELVVATRDGDVIVKRFRQADDDQWLEANDTKIPIADVELKGVVIGLYRSKR